MSAFLIVLLILYVLPSHITRAGVSPDYLTKEATAPVKGLFLLLVFATHFVQYVKLGGVWNDAYLSMRSWMAQLVVVPFLFYSGYGVMTSIAAKGKSYVDSIPVKRALKVLFMFDVAVLVLYLLTYCAFKATEHVTRPAVRNGLALGCGASRLMPASSRCESPS